MITHKLVFSTCR